MMMEEEKQIPEAEKEVKEVQDESPKPLSVSQDIPKKDHPKFVWTWKSFFFSFIWLAAVVLIIDFATKWGVVNFFRANPDIHQNPNLGNGSPSLEIIPHFFYITLSYNTGSSFGMGSNMAWMRYVFIVISWLASGFIVWYWLKNLHKKDRWIDCVLALVLGGALGNAIDRTFYWEGTVGFSGVVDFLQFYIFGFQNNSFAIFNVADAALVVGVILLVVIVLVRSIKEARAKN